MGGGGHVLKRIPRIRFPERHPKSTASGSVSATQPPSNEAEFHHGFSSKSDVPTAPRDTTMGGKASLQPKRTPVTDKEIEAIMLGGCF